MHKLGLIGGTGPESTLLYYRELTHRVEEKSGALPPLVIESLSVYRVLEYCQKNDDAGLAAYLLDGINNLARAGAEAATLTGITPHRVFDRLQAASPLPLISMLDVSARRRCRLVIPSCSCWAPGRRWRGPLPGRPSKSGGLRSWCPPRTSRPPFTT